MKCMFLSAALASGLGLVVPAAAQSPCGETYRVAPGDTLYQITQQCRVSMSSIMNLNPDLAPRDISVGTEIRLAQENGGAGNTSPNARGEREDGRYRVAAGDTLYSIAERLGVSVFELMNANANVDPFALAVGEWLDIPGNGPAASVSVIPDEGSPGEAVTLSARNLRPNDWVTVGVGPRASEWRELRSVQVAADGELSTQVAVPEWAGAGDDLIFVVDTDRGITLKSGVFDVISAGDGDGGNAMTLTGRVSDGVECTILETRDGDVWSLVSDEVRFTPGEYVEVEGTRAEASFCMQGVGTLDVTAIREVEPPAGD